MKEMDPFPKTAKPVILLVDDSEDLLDYLSADLKKKFHVYTAKDGYEALGILQHKFVELVVSDVIMPAMEGFELCVTIKTTPGLSHVPVILLTGKNTLQSRIQGLKTGADAYIEKPFSIDHLFVQIDNLLENRLKLKESYTRSSLVPINGMVPSKADEVFGEQLTDMILNNLHNTNLDVQSIAVLMNMSRSTLYRNIKTLSGGSPNDVINLARLKKAAELINAGNFRINELAREVGYRSSAQLRRNFQKQFKMALAAYIEKVKSAIRVNAKT
jgi:DNA-binding response OmpR family regulator